MALRMAGAHVITPEQDPELYDLVHELTLSAGMPMPRLAIIDDPSPNAFATGRDPAHAVVGVTAGIRRLLNRSELQGVLAHELSHVRNRDILLASVAATLAGAITLIARWGAFFSGGNGRSRSRGSSGALGALLLLVLAPLAAMLVQLALSRAREFQADASGAQLLGDADPLARALEKLEYASRQVPIRQADPAVAHLFIVNPLRASSLAALFSTHPPTAERIQRLLEMETHQPFGRPAHGMVG
jgi:heat shock protein HtpX